MTAKECLVEFKKNYCDKNPESNGDPEFRCLVNTFINRHENKEGK